MLDRLDRIDWTKIYRWNGTAEHFPEWLRALLADDDAVWSMEDLESPYDHILECSNHEGTIYEVTPIITPFIIELLQVVPARRKAQLLHLLSSFAASCQFGADDLPYDVQDLWPGTHSEDPQALAERYDHAIYATRIMLDSGLPVFLNCLDHEMLLIRRCAVDLLEHMLSWDEENALAIQDALAVRLCVEPTLNLKQKLTDLLEISAGWTLAPYFGDFG